MHSPERGRISSGPLRENPGIGGRIGKGVGNAAVWSAEKIWYAWHGSARWLYEHGRMQGLISWEPVYYNQGIPKEVRESVGVVSVSLPFKLGGKYYPATRESGWMRKLLLGDIHQLYDPDFPQMILSYEDPHPEMTGDEVIRLNLTNIAQRTLNPPKTAGIVWRMWMPGTERIAVASYGGEPIEREHADMTAGDVVDMLITTISERSQGKIIIYPAHLHAALRMITEVSPRLNERWKILDERMKFSRNLMEERHRVVMNMKLVVWMEGGDISDILEQIRTGKIQTWGEFNTAIDDIQGGRHNLMIHPGGNPDTALVVSSGSATAVRDMNERLQDIPPSLFLNLRGLKFFNKMLELQRLKLDPAMESLAGTVVDTQVAATQYQEKFIRLRLAAWKAALMELDAGKRGLLRGVRAVVSDEIAALQVEIEGQITSRPSSIIDIPQIPPVSGQPGTFSPIYRTPKLEPGGFNVKRDRKKPKSPTQPTSAREIFSRQRRSGNLPNVTPQSGLPSYRGTEPRYHPTDNNDIIPLSEDEADLDEE